MSAFTDFMEAALLNHVWRGQASPRQDTYWIALFTTATDDAGGGTEVDTADWTNYARVSVDASAASSIFTAPTTEGGGGMAVDNSVAIDFGTATIVTPPNVTHIAVMDAASVGNMLKQGPLTTGKTVSDGDPVTIPIGDLLLALR